jgi:hypothetical protein
MVSFVVETWVATDVQDRFPAQAEGIRKASTAAGLSGPVHILRSYLVPGDEMGFHVLEATTVEDVARVAALAGIEVERIVEAIGVEPRTV